MASYRFLGLRNKDRENDRKGKASYLNKIKN